MLKIGSVRWRGKCPRHPRFDPYMDGRAAIKAGCDRCAALVDIHNHHIQMLTLMRGFTPPQKTIRRPSKKADLQASLFGDT